MRCGRSQVSDDSAWLAAAYTAVVVISKRSRSFTTDDVWEFLGKNRPHEPRVMGAVMRRAVVDKIIESTGQYVMSKRVASHRRPIKVWQRVRFRDL